MAPRDLDNLLEKYLKGECTKEERDLVDSLYGSLGNDPSPSQDSDIAQRAASAHYRMLAHITTHASSDTASSLSTRTLSLWRICGIAASVLLCVSTVFYFFKPTAKPQTRVETASSPPFSSIQNVTDLSRRVILPDGSLIQMAPGSTIRFANDNTARSRELFLEGEAYFDIAHDPARPFYVYAGDVITRVVGTSFIVDASTAKEKVTVSVKTGKVTVYSRNTAHKKTVLTSNQEAVYDRATDVIAAQEIPVARLEEENKHFTEMHFDETPVSQVLALLTRTYDIEIIFDEETLSGCVLTSSFFEEGLYDRIDVICTAIAATYRIVDAQIVIESNGCNLKPD